MPEQDEMPTVPDAAVSGPKSRLMISKMVLENFKSYAGVKCVGPFHKCFSSVVGPNGSGKSNVIDAMLFVFGKKAKKLRLNKVSELIHKSTTYPNCQSARVTVYFQDIIDTDDTDTGYEVIPGSELSVTRVAGKDNSSKYYLNDKASNFTEVTQLLRTRGIDLDNNRFLILQGEVEQIAMMKPKAQNPHEEGILEYLEDIIGSNRFVEQIEELEKVVGETQEKRLTSLNRVKLVEKEKDNLEGAKKEAEEYLSKEKQISLKKGELYQIYTQEAAKNVVDMNGKNTQMMEKLDYEQSKLKETEGQLETIEKTYNESTEEYEQINAEMGKCKKEFTAFERRDIKYREDLKHAKTQVKKLEASIKTETAKAKQLAVKAEAELASQPELEKSVEVAEQELEQEQTKLDKIEEDLKDETEKLRVQVEIKQHELAPYHESIDAAKSKTETAQTEIDLVISSSATAQKQLQEVESKVKEIESTLPKRQQLLVELNQQQIEKKQRQKDVEQELNGSESREQSLTAHVKELRTKTYESRAMQQNSSTKGHLLQRLLDASKGKGPLKNAGFKGRLGDLGTIDSKYDVAISTACNALDNLVCETTSGAQQCLQFLKQHSLGRATFIILEQMQNLAPRCAETIKTPEGVPRLFDLVKPANAAYSVAFYYGLRDCLVAKDLTQSLRVSTEYGQRYKVVSLDGQLCDKSGTMTGGGRNKRQGGMAAVAAQEIDPAEMRAMEEELSAAELSLTEISQLRRNLKLELQQLTKELPKLATQISKLEIELAGADTRRDGLQEQVTGLKKAAKMSKEDEARLKTLQGQLQGFQKELKTANANAADLEKEVAALQKQMKDFGGPRLKRQRVVVEKLSNKVDEATTAVSKAKVESKSCTKNAEKAQAESERMTKELEKVQGTMEKTRGEFKQIEEDAMKVMDSYKRTQELLEVKGEACKEIRTEFDGLKSQVSKVRTVEVEIQGQLEEYARVLKENSAKEGHWRKKLQELKDAFDEEDDEEEDEQQEEVVMEDGDEHNADAVKAPQKLAKQIVILSDEEVAAMSKDDIKYEITILEQERDHMKRDVNMAAIKKFQEKEVEYLERVSELDAVTSERDEARANHEAARRQRLEEFMAGFSIITTKLKEMYQMITLGGDAELELVDSLDPFSEGIVFSVRPHKKSWKNISNLSGGEKTLSSLALVFALHHYRPTPLYVMDEIDAALDFKNVSIVANYIKERTRNAQFIIISLRNNMFELADRLVGIYKTNDATKSVTIDPKQLVIAAKTMKPPAAPAVALQESTNTTNHEQQCGGGVVAN
jgi:structural maintenance of chromosome 4